VEREFELDGGTLAVPEGPGIGVRARVGRIAGLRCGGRGWGEVRNRGYRKRDIEVPATTASSRS
jgi:hypothetical protein